MGRDIIMILSSSKKILIKIEEKLEIEDKLIINKDLEVEVELLGKEAETGRERRSKFMGFKE